MGSAPEHDKQPFAAIRAMTVLRGLGIVAVFMVYVLLVHQVNVLGKPTALAAALAITPLFVVALGMAINHTTRLAGIALLTFGSAITWAIWPYLMLHYALVFWLQDVGLMLLLAATFGRTLLPGSKPLCVLFAEMMNGGQLPAEHERYARKLTWVWVAFFIAIALTSTLLFMFAELATWSMFVNFFTLPLVGLMFLVEYAVRRRVLSNLPNSHIMDAVRAYRNHRAGMTNTHVP